MTYRCFALWTSSEKGSTVQPWTQCFCCGRQPPDCIYNRSGAACVRPTANSACAFSITLVIASVAGRL